MAGLEKEGVGKGKVIFTWCDFSTPEKAKESGEKFLSQVERLDVLGEFSIVVLVRVGVAYKCGLGIVLNGAM